MAKFHLGYDTIMKVVLEVNLVLVTLYHIFSSHSVRISQKAVIGPTVKTFMDKDN